MAKLLWIDVKKWHSPKKILIVYACEPVGGRAQEIAELKKVGGEVRKPAISTF